MLLSTQSSILSSLREKVRWGRDLDSDLEVASPGSVTASVSSCWGGGTWTGQRGKCLDTLQQEGTAVLAAEARPVPPQGLSAAQLWLRPSQPTQLSSPPPPEASPAVDRDQKRIMQTHSWI